MTKVIGWAALVGGALSGALAGLLLLGPMLGFYGWDHSGPGARSSGSLALPAALEQARSPATRSPLTAPVGTLTLAGGGTVSAFAPVSPGVSRSATPRLGRLERV
ncbi:MAG: hypothetical protein JWM73_1488, partial [Solirubrobacterales bacterium]|nr:hypothetical protein [Solirubrobacterales bacterium]